MRVAIALLVACGHAAWAQSPPRLVGTVVAAETRQAMFDVSPGVRSAGLEDTVGTWRVIAIEPGLVLLSGPGGDVEVRIAGAPGPVLSPPPGWANPCGRLHPHVSGTGGHDHGACHTALARATQF